METALVEISRDMTRYVLCHQTRACMSMHEKIPSVNKRYQCCPSSTSLSSNDKFRMNQSQHPPSSIKYRALLMGSHSCRVAALINATIYPSSSLRRWLQPSFVPSSSIHHLHRPPFCAIYYPRHELGSREKRTWLNPTSIYDKYDRLIHSHMLLQTSK